VDTVEEVYPYEAEEFIEFDDGEAENVLVAAIIAGDEEAAGPVNGIGAGAVEGVDDVNKPGDFGFGQGAEGDVGGFGAFGGLAGFGVDNRKPGNDLVGVSGEAAEHGAGFFRTGGLGQDVLVEKYEGVGGNHDGGVGELARDVIAFGAGIGLDDGGGHRARIIFSGLAGNDLEFKTERGEQRAPPRRSGCQHQRYHGFFGASAGAGGARSFTCTEEGFSSAGGTDTLKRSASG